MSVEDLKRELRMQEESIRPQLMKISELRDSIKEIESKSNLDALLKLRGKCFKSEFGLYRYLDKPPTSYNEIQIFVVDFYHPNEFAAHIRLFASPLNLDGKIEITHEEFDREILRKVNEYVQDGYFADETK